VTVVDITQWYSPTSGGIRTYLHAKAGWARSRGVVHAAIVPGERVGPVQVAGSTFVTLRGRTPSRRWGYRLMPRSGEVIAALEDLGPRVIVVHDALAFPHAVAAWARERAVPVAMVCHSDLALAAEGLPAGARWLAGTVLGAVQTRALGAPQVVMVASGATQRRIASRTRVPVVVSRLGVETGSFRDGRRDPALRGRLAPPGHRLVLYAGRLSAEKRVDLLPRMLVHLPPDTVLVIAGTGSAAGRVRRLARRLGVSDRLRMVGHLDGRGALADLMASADCFVHPNPNEPFGLCPLEARAAGCPVVVPEGSGTAEFLAGRGAVIVAPGYPRALAAGVVRALSDPPGPADLADLSWEATFAREWDLYEELVRACA
jgi:alpha-1,6-mannosyltransferase